MTQPQQHDPLLPPLLTAQLEVEGVLPDASNLTARVILSGAEDEPPGGPTGEGTGPIGDTTPPGPVPQRALYKPIGGEAPLRDFPGGTLGRREVAAYQISALGGWDLIPETVLREGPLGAGSVQRWIDWETAGNPPGDGLLEAFPADSVPAGWLVIVHGEDPEGRPVVVAHRDSPDLASMAVLDVVLNNADRKGAHLVRDADGRLWGFDHGLTLHVEDKLRTVLWGWAGDPLPDDDLQRLTRLRDGLDPRHTIAQLISPAELDALGARVDGLLADPVFPELPTGRYPLPWPLW